MAVVTLSWNDSTACSLTEAPQCRLYVGCLLCINFIIVSFSRCKLIMTISPTTTLNAFKF